MTRDLSNSNKEMDRIKIRDMEKSSDLERMRLYLLEEQSNLNTRESEIRKFRAE